MVIIAFFASLQMVCFCSSNIFIMAALKSIKSGLWIPKRLLPPDFFHMSRSLTVNSLYVCLLCFLENYIFSNIPATDSDYSAQK